MPFDLNDPYDAAAFLWTLFVCERCNAAIDDEAHGFDSDETVGSHEWYHALGQHARRTGWLVDPDNGIALCPACKVARLPEEDR